MNHMTHLSLSEVETVLLLGEHEPRKVVPGTFEVCAPEIRDAGGGLVVGDNSEVMQSWFRFRTAEDRRVIAGPLSSIVWVLLRKPMS